MLITSFPLLYSHPLAVARGCRPHPDGQTTPGNTAAKDPADLGVSDRTVMDIMGWTDARMLSRYQHVVDEPRHDAARRMGATLWGDTDPTPAAPAGQAAAQGAAQDSTRKAVCTPCVFRKTTRPKTDIRSPVTCGFMEPPVGIEPTTYALRVRRSGRLS
jgi:hypothetical protein